MVQIEIAATRRRILVNEDTAEDWAALVRARAEFAQWRRQGNGRAPLSRQLFAWRVVMGDEPGQPLSIDLTYADMTAIVESADHDTVLALSPVDGYDSVPVRISDTGVCVRGNVVVYSEGLGHHRLSRVVGGPWALAEQRHAAATLAAQAQTTNEVLGVLGRDGGQPAGHALYPPGRGRGRKMEVRMVVTDDWFDGDTQNPLHPVGVVIDPLARRIVVADGAGYAVPYGGNPLVSRDYFGIRSWFAYVGDVVVLYGADQPPTAREAWAD